MTHSDPTLTHAGPAWLLHGIMNTPGVLALENGRLSFTSDHGVVFSELLGPDRAVTFPWYYFSGGFKITAGGARRRISLTRPNGAPSPGRTAAELAGLDLLVAASFLGDAAKGRRQGRTWRALLLPDPPRTA